MQSGKANKAKDNLQSRIWFVRALTSFSDLFCQQRIPPLRAWRAPLHTDRRKIRHNAAECRAPDPSCAGKHDRQREGRNAVCILRKFDRPGARKAHKCADDWHAGPAFKSGRKIRNNRRNRAEGKNKPIQSIFKKPIND